MYWIRERHEIGFFFKEARRVRPVFRNIVVVTRDVYDVSSKVMTWYLSAESISMLGYSFIATTT